MKTPNGKKENLQKKLHKQFGHSNTSKILKFVKTSEIENNKLLQLIDETGNCSICLKYKKALLKLVVGLPYQNNLMMLLQWILKK